MPKSGPIVIVEDDIDDQEIMEGALRELGISNEIVFLNNGDEGLNYLKGNFKKQPFLILSDINMPGMNGVELKRQIDSDPELRRKSIPFIFFVSRSDSLMPSLFNISGANVTNNIRRSLSFPATISSICSLLSESRKCPAFRICFMPDSKIYKTFFKDA